MATVTGDLGGQPISLDNAATENTLRELLAAVNRQTAILGRQLQGRGGAGGSGGNAQAQQQQTQAQTRNTQALNQGSQAQGANTQSVNSGTKAMDGLAKTAGFLGGVIGDLAGSAFKTVGNLTDFAGSLMDGQGSLSGFYGALKDLPLGLGMVAGLFEKIAKMQEAELNTYRQLQTAGVNFGGSLGDVRMNALSLGMTMEEYAKTVTKNADVMQLLGGTTNKGAEYFNRLNRELRESEAGRDLRALGMTAEDTANGMANYIRMTGGRTQEELRNTKAIGEAAAGYMKNLNALSQLTGESKEQLEQKMAEEANEASFQAYMQTLNEEQRAKAMQGLQDALATGGKGAAQAFKDKVQGLPPLTEAGQAFTATMSRANKAQDAQIAAIKDSSKSLEDVKKTGDGMRVGMVQDTKAFGAQTAAALARSNDATGEMVRQGLKVQNQLNAAGVKNAEDETARRQKIEEEQRKLSKSAASNAAESEKAFKDMGAAIYGALQPALAAIVPIINKLAQEFMGFVIDNLPAIKEALTKLAVMATDFAKNLFSDAGREKIINDAVYYLKLIWLGIKETLPGWLGGGKEKADQEREALKAEREGFDKRAEAARTEMENRRALQALELASNSEKMKAHQAETARVADEVKVLEEEKKNNKNFTVEQQRLLDEKTRDLKKLKQQEVDAKNSELVQQGRDAVKAIDKAKADARAADITAKETREGPPPAPVTQEELAAMGGLSADKGGIFKGPETGFPVMLHGHEAVVPMDMIEAVSKNILPATQTNVMPAIQPQMDIKDMPPITLDTSQLLGKNLVDILRKEIQPIDLENGSDSLKEHFNKLNSILTGDRSALNDLIKSTQEFSKNKESQSSEEYKINGKQVSKGEFDQYLKENPKLAELMQSAQNPKIQQPIVDPTAVPKEKESTKTEGLFETIGATFPEFVKKLPGITDLGSVLKDKMQEFTGVANINKQLEELKKEKVPGEESAMTQTEKDQSRVTNESLIKELQQLNKNTVEMIKYLRQGVDESRQTVQGIRSLSGNLYN